MSSSSRRMNSRSIASPERRHGGKGRLTLESLEERQLMAADLETSFMDWQAAPASDIAPLVNMATDSAPVTQPYQSLVYDLVRQEARVMPAEQSAAARLEGFDALESAISMGSPAPQQTSPTTIFSVDERTRVPSALTTTYPYSAAGRLWMRFPSGRQGGCSGTLISPNHVLAAAHCVQNDVTHELANQVVFSAGQSEEAINGSFRRSEYQPFGEANATAYHLYNAWGASVQNWDFDLTVVTLDRNLGAYTGAVGYGHDNNAFYQNNRARSLGYPGDLTPTQLDMFEQFGNAADYGLTNNLLLTNSLDVYPGQSGSSMLYQQNGGWVSHGVWSHQNSVYNAAKRITSVNYADITNWINSDATVRPPQDLADLTDHDAWFNDQRSHFSPVQAQPGRQLSVSAAIRNNGTAATGSFHVRFYASLDGDISASDTLLGQTTVTGLNPFDTIDVPWAGSLPILPAGQYYVGWIIDSGNVEQEFVEADNTGRVTNALLNVLPYGVDDRFEPNDNVFFATNLHTGDQTQTGLNLTYQDQDVFGWIAPADGQATVRIDFSHAQGDIDLEVKNDLTGTVYRSNGYSDREEVTFPVTRGQWFTIRVYGYQDVANPAYDLRVFSPAVQADRFEPNDAMLNAALLPAGDSRQNDLTLHAPLDNDWFRWKATANGPATVDLQFLHRVSDVDLQVLDDAGVLIAGSYSTNDAEQVQFSAIAGQSYFIRVYSFDANAQFDYDLAINGPEILADRFEPNNGAKGATVLGTGDRTLAGLTVHEANNHDWYRWTAPATGALNVSAAFRHAAGDLDLRLYDDSAVPQQLAVSRTSNDIERVTAQVVAGRSYLIRVIGANGALNPDYTLVVDGPEILADRFEPNDGLRGAANLGTGDQTRTGLTVHAANNHDWFVWTAPASGTLNVDVSFSHVAGNLALSVYDDSTVPRQLAISRTSADRERATIAVVAGRRYYIRVYGESGALSPGYSLALNGPGALSSANTARAVDLLFGSPPEDDFLSASRTVHRQVARR